MAGEIYTTFTFLGGSGWAYSKGAPTFYILGYGALAYLLSYFYCHRFGSMRKSITLFHIGFLRRNIEVKRLGLLFQLLVLFPSSHILFYS